MKVLFLTTVVFISASAIAGTPSPKGTQSSKQLLGAKKATAAGSASNPRKPAQTSGDNARLPFDTVKAAFDRLLACRTVSITPEDETKPKEVVRAKMQPVANCFHSHFSSRLDDRQQAETAFWLSGIKTVHSAWACTAEEYQLHSYSAATPNFICVKVTDTAGAEATRLLFFEAESGDLKLSSVYVPPF